MKLYSFLFLTVICSVLFIAVILPLTVSAEVTPDNSGSGNRDNNVTSGVTVTFGNLTDNPATNGNSNGIIPRNFGFAAIESNALSQVPQSDREIIPENISGENGNLKSNYYTYSNIDPALNLNLFMASVFFLLTGSLLIILENYQPEYTGYKGFIFR